MLGSACGLPPAAVSLLRSYGLPLAHLPCSLVLDLDETLVHSTLDGYCRPGRWWHLRCGPLPAAASWVHC